MINKDTIKEIIVDFKDQIQKEKDILSLYIIAFGDVHHYDDGETEPEVEIYSVYQYLNSEIEEFMESNDSYDNLSKFNNFLSDLFGNVSIYRYNGDELCRIFPTGIKDIDMGHLLCNTIRGVECSVIVEDSRYLYTIIASLCDLCNLLRNEYSELIDKTRETNKILRDIKQSLYDSIYALDKDINTLSDFYNYISKAIDDYKKKEGK